MKNKKLQFVLGLVLGVFLVWFLFKDTNWRELGRAITHAHWGWITVSLGGVLISFVTRVQRWSYIVRTSKPVSFRHLFNATQIGFLANFTLPARAGEAIRALVLGRLAQLPFTRSLAFVALDRVTDLIGLMATILVAALAFRPEADIHLPEFIYAAAIPADMVGRYALRLAFLLLLIVFSFVLLYLQQRLVIRISDRVLSVVSPRLAHYVHGLLQHFADGLHVFRSAADMARSVFFSLLTWSMFIVTYGTLLLAFGLDLPWYAPFVICSFLALAISVPGAPGFIGQFHFGVVIPIIILMPGPAMEQSYNTALAVAVVAHLLNVVPVLAVGIVSLYWEQLGLLQLSRESEQEQEVHTASQEAH